MNKKIYVTDGDFSLVRIAEEDKEKYISLVREISADELFCNNSETGDIFWKCVTNNDKINCFIYTADGFCCGDVSVSHLNDTTPEIGVELVQTMRNKGIAARCIKMLARKVYEERNDIEYFILRVSKSNLHSRHMIEKMGAIFIGEEESVIKKLFRKIKQSIDKEESIGEKYRNLLDEFSEEEEDKKSIYTYKLTPKLFLQNVL